MITLKALDISVSLGTCTKHEYVSELSKCFKLNRK